MNKPTRKVVFLDIDGVLNSSSELRSLIDQGHSQPGQLMEIQKLHVAILNRLVESVPGVEFVLSSSWRLLHSLKEMQFMLDEKGFIGKLIDETGRMPRHCRGSEIGKWLAEKGKDVRSFVILDDDSDMGPLTPHLIKTTFENGLRHEHAEEAIARLSFDGCHYWYRPGEGPFISSN